MQAAALNDLAADVSRLLGAGSTSAPRDDRFRGQLPVVQSLAEQVPALAPLAESAARAAESEGEPGAAALLDLNGRLQSARFGMAEAGREGEMEDFPAGGEWFTPMPWNLLYQIAPSERGFPRARAKAQFEGLQEAVRLGVAADLRLVDFYLGTLAWGESPLADLVAGSVLPRFGATVLPEVGAYVSVSSRGFATAYAIDSQTAVAWLLEDAQGDGGRVDAVVEAAKSLMEAASKEGRTPGADAVPLLRAGLHFAPDAAQRHRFAAALAQAGPEAAGAVPELVAALERALSRDIDLIRPLAVIGKESPEAVEALARALTDRSSVVRVMAAFNLGLMGGPATDAIPALERAAAGDSESKVRDQAARTLAKLRQRLAPPEGEMADAGTAGEPGMTSPG